MTDFDAQAKEDALRSESERWDTSTAIDAAAGDIPIIDISGVLERSPGALADVAEQLNHACETVGFWLLTGHGIPAQQISAAFAETRRFHGVPVEHKTGIELDRPGWPLGGVGYLPVDNRKLPARSTGNRNEAFIVKGGLGSDPDSNQWLDEDVIPGFRSTIESFAGELEGLTQRLLPIYATALGLEPDWFAPGFERPFWRLRMTRYPGISAESAETGVGHDGEPGISAGSAEKKQYGINPHVDTTFMTLLLQDSPGLTIYHTPKQRWINVPVIEDAFVVNSGELLRQWTNDRYLSVRHYANSPGTEDRYSIPFFVNADRDYPMAGIPTCCDEDNPPKYPTISYNQSQAVVQGE